MGEVLILKGIYTSKEEMEGQLNTIKPLLSVEITRWEEPLPASARGALLNYLYSICQLGLEFPPTLTIASVRAAHVLLSCTTDTMERVGNKPWIDAMDLAAEFSTALVRYAKQLEHDIKYDGEHVVVFDEELFPD